MNLKIGFDLDGIFIDSPLLVPKSLVERLYKKKNKHLSYRIPGTVERYIRVASHNKRLRPPIKINLSAINRLRDKKNVSTYLITSRFSFLKARTSEWIDHYKLGINADNMFFNYKDEQPHIFKEKILRQEKINIFVDDDLDLLKYLSERNPDIKFYWADPKELNIELPKNIIHIKNVEEFVNKF